MKKFFLSRISFSNFLAVLLSVISISFCNGQNLISNASFETLLSPVTGEGQIILAAPWLSPPMGTGTPDLFNSAYSSVPANPCDAVGIPLNAGGYAPSLSGNGYAGISIDFINHIYEYLEVPLTIPMQAGETYTVEMDVLRADSSEYACNRIGVVFSASPLNQTGSGLIGNPVMENAAVITDTASWSHLTFNLVAGGSGIYTAAGGENYITIGEFRDVSSPLLNLIPYGPQGSQCANFVGRAYYYIDNVIVKPVNEVVAITGDTIICPNESTVLTANSNVPFWWSDQFNPTDTLSLNIDLTVTPSTNTTYYLHGQIKTYAVTVYIVNPPVFNLGPDTTFCEADTVVLNAFSPDAILYTWSTGDTTATTLATDTGLYWVIVDNIGCGVFDSIYFNNLLPNPPVDIGTDSMYCFFDGDTLSLDAGSNAVSYSWIPFGDTTQVVKVLVPAYYQVTVTHANGCKRRAGFETQEICLPKIFMPSAFTPDGDGLNDVFLPTVNNVTSYALRVFSREGAMLFSTQDIYEGWDGTFNGKEMPTGVYTYKLSYSGFDSEAEKTKGKFVRTITLIR